MKRLLTPLLVVLLGLQLSACNSSSEEPIVNEIEAKMHIVEEAIGTGKTNHMTIAYEQFPDLSLIRSVGPDDDFSISQQSLEDWLYSKESRVTVIMWNDHNTPLHVFAGNSLSKEQVKSIREKRAALFE